LTYSFVEDPLRRASWSASKLATIGLALLAAVCSGAFLYLLNGKFRGVLYAGTSVQMVAQGVESMIADKWHAGNLIWPARDCVLSSDNEVGKPIDFDICKLKEPVARAPAFLVVGNSFSAAEFEMYSALAEAGAGSVIATSSFGASAVPELPPMAGPYARASDYYWNSVFPRLSSRLEQGDVLIMINDLYDLTPKRVTPEVRQKLSLLRSSLSRIAKELQTRGIEILFQTQNPLFREANCTPDRAKAQWFKLHAAGCNYYTKAYSLERIRGLYEALDDLGAENPNFHILDLFPVLCPGDLCQFNTSQGVPLYRDEWSHMSVEASYLARPLFVSVVNQIQQRRDAMHRSAVRP
jgi:hypothetical protein